MVVELAISGVEEKLTIRKGLFLRGIGSEKKVSLRGVGKSFVGSHLSKRDVPSCKGREHGNTSSSPRASVISILELTFLCDSHRA